MARTSHHRACHLCEAICGLVIDVDGDGADARVVGIKGDPLDPLSHGHLCPKGVALMDLHHDPDRLTRPLLKRGNDFEEVDWDTAFDAVAAGIRGVQARHGKNAVGVYLGNPTVHSLGALTYGQAFVKSIGTHAHFSATSLDQLPHMLAALQLFGNQYLLPVPDIDRARHFIVMGANPLASNGSIMTAPGMKRRLAAVRERGGRVVVVDPRRTETAAVADRHMFIRPGTDAALLLAIAKGVVARGVRLHHLAGVVDGIDAACAAVRDVDVDAVAAFTGVAVADIDALVDTVVDGGVVYGRIGVCTQEFGGLAAYLVVLVNLLAGLVDRPGGLMFANPAVDLAALTAQSGARGSFGKHTTRVRGLPVMGSELPAATLAEEIDVDGPAKNGMVRLRGLVTHAGNPALSTPNATRLAAALPTLEFMASIDFYVNETTRHAQVILPPASPLARDHYDLVFHALAVRNTARFNRAIVPRPAHARHDWEIFAALTARLQPSRARRVAVDAALRLAGERGPRMLIDVLLRRGPHKLSVAQLSRSPHGVDLGPLTPQLPARLQTKTGRIQALPSLYVDDLARLRRAIAAPRPAPGLVAIGRRELRSNNSWLHNHERLMRGDNRCTLLIHPDDARARGIASGAVVDVNSAAGRVSVVAVVDDSVMPGVVSLPHGFGHGQPGTRLGVANAHAGVSLNDLSVGAVDPLSGNAVLTGFDVAVAVAGAPGAPPAPKEPPLG
jgi:anaerobic selenocysteine-containing dehydrogenase